MSRGYTLGANSGQIRRSRDAAAGEAITHNGRTAQRLDLTAVLLKNGEDPARGGHGLLGGVPDAGEEEVQPDLPVVLGPHAVQRNGGKIRSFLVQELFQGVHAIEDEFRL